MPRAGLTRERVIEQAAVVADEVGLEHLTLAAVARRCGVSLPGLYKHVDGLENVKRDIGLRAVRELTGILAAAAAGVSGHEALTEFARAYRAYARLHRGYYGAILHAPPPGDDEYAAVAASAVAVIASALKGYQLEGPALIHAVRILRATFHGIASLEIAGGFGLPESVDDTYAHLVDALDTAFRSQGPGPYGGAGLATLAPPSTRRIWPVMKPASSDRRK
jgi:AcrR family transcriptional regulator